MTRTEFRLAGFGGQGVVLAGFILGKAACVHAGLRATMTQNYGPESRGGACAADVVVEDIEGSYPLVQSPDALVLLSQEAAMKYRRDAEKARVAMIDADLVHLPDSPGRFRALPFTATAERLGRRIVANMVMLGALAAATNVVPRSALEETIKETVPKKTVNLNLDAFSAGWPLGLIDARLHGGPGGPGGGG